MVGTYGNVLIWTSYHHAFFPSYDFAIYRVWHHHIVIVEGIRGQVVILSLDKLWVMIVVVLERFVFQICGIVRF